MSNEIKDLSASELRIRARAKCKADGIPSSWTVNADGNACRAFLDTGIAPSTLPTPSVASGNADVLRKLLEIMDGNKGATVEQMGEIKSEIADLCDKLSVVSDSIPLVCKTVLDSLLDSKPNVLARIPIARAIGAEPNGILAKVSPYYIPGRQATVCLVTSPPSFGKSFDIRLLGKSYDVFIEHNCSPDIDEISTLLGSVAPDGKGGFITFDGVLTQAVRHASNGKTVLFFADELLRLADKSQEWLLMFLAPLKIDGKTYFRLRTRKVLENGELEVLTCPAENFHFIGASNLTGYAPQLAFWSRFKPIRFDFSLDFATAKAEQMMVNYGIADASLGAPIFATAMQATRKACQDGLLFAPVDFRTLERACLNASMPTWQDVARDLAASVADGTLWGADSGDTDGASAAEALRISTAILASV